MSGGGGIAEDGVERTSHFEHENKVNGRLGKRKKMGNWKGERRGCKNLHQQDLW